MRDKVFDIIKQVGIIILLILGMFVPSFIAVFINELIPSFQISAIIGNLIYVAVMIYLFRKTLFGDFKKFKKEYVKCLDQGFKYWILGLIVMVISNLIINYLVFGGEIATNETEVRKMIFELPYYSALSMLLIAPLTEELIFRAAFKPLSKNPIVFASLSALVFGGLHAITGITSILDLLYIIPYGSLGFFLAYMYSKTNNIWTDITIHAIHNTISFVLVLVLL